MSSAELASLADTLEQAAKRLAAIADESQKAKREDVASSLYDIERAVLNAQRRLEKLLLETGGDVG